MALLSPKKEHKREAWVLAVKIKKLMQNFRGVSGVGCLHCICGALEQVRGVGSWAGYQRLASLSEIPNYSPWQQYCRDAVLGLSSSVYMASEITSKLSVRFLILSLLFLAFNQSFVQVMVTFLFNVLPIITAVFHLTNWSCRDHFILR